MTLLLACCASRRNPVKPSSEFADDVAASKDEAAQAALTSGQFDPGQDNTYITCMRVKG
jgi:hypothetical protein